MDGLAFDVRVVAGEAGYELHPEDWNRLEELADLTVGQTLIFTRKRATKFWLTGFSRDEGSLTTAARFLGATNLLPDQHGLFLTERGKKFRNTFIIHVISAASELFSDYN